MISNTDSTLLIYSTEHIRVKAYKGRGARQRFQSACGDARLMRFWRVQFRALGAPDRFHLMKLNTFQHSREASVATRRWCTGSSRNAVRLPPEQALSFAGIPKQSSGLRELRSSTHSPTHNSCDRYLSQGCDMEPERGRSPDATAA